MAKQEYISVEVKVYLKNFRMCVKVPTKNYENNDDAWINGEKLVQELIDNGEIKLEYNGVELPKELIGFVNCWSDDSYEADFTDSDHTVLPNEIAYPSLK